MADTQDTDVNLLRFGKEFEGVNFLANTTARVLFKSFKAEGKWTPDVFDKSLDYTSRFGGALQTEDVTAIDELFHALKNIDFIRTRDDGSEERQNLHSYETVALVNLNPGSVAAAKGLIPSLERFTEEELEEVLKLLRRSSARFTGLGLDGRSGEGGASSGGAGSMEQ